MAQRQPPTLAVIGDVHGNLPAFEATLADLERVQPDRVVMAGDYVSRGPQSHAVVARARALGFPAISGNHDTRLVSQARGEALPEGWDGPWWTPARMAAQEMTPEDLAWLAALPFSLRIELPGAEPALLVHGHPRSASVGMGSWTNDAQLAEALTGVEEQTIIGAHIHYPHERWLGEWHTIAVSAVGCPANCDTNAQYGLFTWRDGVWTFEHRSVAYDHEPLYAAWRERGYLADGSVSAELMFRDHQAAGDEFGAFLAWMAENDLEPTRANLAVFSAARSEAPRTVSGDE